MNRLEKEYILVDKALIRKLIGLIPNEAIINADLREEVATLRNSAPISIEDLIRAMNSGYASHALDCVEDINILCSTVNDSWLSDKPAYVRPYVHTGEIDESIKFEFVYKEMVFIKNINRADLIVNDGFIVNLLYNTAEQSVNTGVQYGLLKAVTNLNDHNKSIIMGGDIHL